MRRRYLALATAFFLLLLGLPAVVGAQETGGGGPTPTGPVRGSLDWSPCPELGGPPGSGAPDIPLECATLDVPVDYDVTDGPTLPLALWRYPALAGPANTRGHLLLNPGGPGGPVLNMILGVGGSGVFAEFDLIGMDPRGVGLSAPMACEALIDADIELGTDYDSIDDFEAFTEKLRSILPQCDDALFPHLGTVNVAHDMDRVRDALGVEQLNYFGASYGTHLGAVYAQLYPVRVGRFILDGPVLLGDIQSAITDNIAGFEDALNRFDAGCAVTTTCALQPYGARSVWRHLKWRYKNAPSTATVEGPDGPTEVVVDFDTFMAAAFFSFNVGRDIWDFYSQALLLAAQGDASLLWEIAQIPNQSPFFEGANRAVECADDATRITAAESQQRAYQQILDGNESFALELGSGASSCEAVASADPTPTIDIAAGDTAPILIVATTHDPATPYDGALRFADAVRSGTLLTVVDDGHTAVSYGEQCVDSIAVNYLVTGEVPPAGSVCEPTIGVIGFDPVGPGENGGLLVGDIYPGSAADGVLMTGDEILLIGGENPLEGPPPIVVGVSVEVQFIRNGDVLSETFVPGAPAYWLPDEFSPGAGDSDATTSNESDAGPDGSGENGADAGDESGPAPYVAGGPIASGTYTTDDLGTSMTMTIGDDWIAAIGEPAAVLLTKTEEQKKGPFSEALIVVRVGAFPAAGEADVEPPIFTGASDDLEAWLADGEFIIENRSDTAVGGRDAVTFDLRVDPDGTRSIPGGCGPGLDDRCVFVVETRADSIGFFIVRTTEMYRFWLIDQGEEDPIMVMAIAAEGNDAFLDESSAVMASLELGEPGPHPVAEATGPLWEAGENAVVPGGQAVTIPAMGGITFTLAEDRLVGQSQNYVTIETNESYSGDSPPNLTIALAQERRLEGTDEAGRLSGLPIADADAVLEILEAAGDVTPTGTTIDALGATLTGYRLSVDRSAVPPFLITAAPAGEPSNLAWMFFGEAEVYLADAPEGGALIIALDADNEADLALAQVVLDEVIPTLAYAEDGGE